MRIKILKEVGYKEALLGLSLSYNKADGDMSEVAAKLYNRDGGHNKFLESMIVWLDITAARYWWGQFDTYRAGVTKQSGSTMHTLMRRELTQKDFERPISPATLHRLNQLIRDKDFNQTKVELPEGFLQRRIVCTSYMGVRRMCAQRMTHRLQEWQNFIPYILKHLQHKEFVSDLQTIWADHQRHQCPS